MENEETKIEGTGKQDTQAKETEKADKTENKGFDINTILKNPEFTKYMESYADKRVTSAMQKKEAEKQAAVEAEKKKANMTNADLQAEIEKMKQDSLHKDLTNKALKYAQEKKLPANLVSYFVGQDEETTKTNLKALEKEFNASVQTEVDSRLKGGYKPPKNNSGSQTAQEQTQAQIYKAFGIKSK